MKAVDTSVFVGKSRSRIKPQEIDLGDLPIIEKPRKGVEPENGQLPEFQTNRLPEFQTSRDTELRGYFVPDFRKMERIEVRLTWEQNKFLDDLEAVISRDAPEGERDNPKYRRITKNSIIRVLVEIVRRLNVEVDASAFRNEADLLIALIEALKNRLPEFQTSRDTE